MPPTDPSQPQGATRGEGDLSGRWIRVDDHPPAADPEAVPFGHDASQFPAEIEFEGSTYRGYKGPGQGFIVWDAGTHSADPQRLSISLANDALESYPMEFGDEEFTVVDALGRRTTYRRAAEGASG